MSEVDAAPASSPAREDFSPGPAERPVTVLIGALGGEGGGVLSGWLVAAAEAAGLPVQTTSVPGVAQRTGATTYYLEIGGVSSADEAGGQVMALLPTPGNVDLVVASELLEAGRAAQAGMITPERTTVIASTHRFYAIAEKSAMGDGRFDTDRILTTVRTLAKEPILGDIGQVAAQSGALMSAVLCGAMAAVGVLPVSAADLRAAIEAGGIAVPANLRGFEAGFAFAEQARLPRRESAGAGEMPVANARLPAELERRLLDLPAEVRGVAELGLHRTLDYQGVRYAERYLARVEHVCLAEGKAVAESRYAVSAEVARALAVWMTFEDVIRVADLKTRRERVVRVREEVRAAPEQPVVIVEYLKPGMDEWAGMLPGALAPGFRRLCRALGLAERMNIGLHIKSTTISGFTLLRLLAAMRWWRPFSSRFTAEQRRIERWLGAIEAALEAPDFALEIAHCANLVKGYGETHERGRGNFDRIFELLTPIGGAQEPAAELARLREAALADPGGAALADLLAGWEAQAR